MLLVTGITGHSGKYFLQELINHKYDGPIRCLVRDTSNTSSLKDCGLNLELLVGDLNDQNFLDKALTNVDTIMHIGSIFYSVNLIKAAVKHDVKRAILVHTTGIYSKYKSASKEYQNIESTVNEILKETNSSIGLIYLRPTMIYGYWNDRNMIVFIKMVDKLRSIPVINGGKSLLQPVHGKDLGKAYYQILSKTQIMSGDYILSGEKPITIIDMFKLIRKYLNKKTTFIPVPLTIAVFGALFIKIITLSKVDYVERVQRMGENRNFSHEKAMHDFGYKPMPFTLGLQKEIEEYKKVLK